MKLIKASVVRALTTTETEFVAEGEAAAGSGIAQQQGKPISISEAAAGSGKPR